MCFSPFLCYNNPMSMRIRAALSACVLAAAALGGGSAPNTEADRPASAQFILGNGLHVMLQEKRDLPLTGIALAIDLGTKDETDETIGYAHLLEHMLLFGPGSEADGGARLAELRGHGVDCNAHTDHDLMTFEVSCPGGESAWALERLRRTVFAGRLDPGQLEREKRVIGEEILQLRDDPDHLGLSLVMEQLFAAHPYGRPVYGDGGSIRAATADRLQAFCAPRLVPGRCALAVIGDFALAEMEGEIRRLWGGMARLETAAADVPEVGSFGKNSERRIALDLQESHLFIGWRAPGFNHEQRLAFTLLTHILGRGLNPLLGGVLRGSRKQAIRFEMRYFPMRGGGMALLHLTLDEKDIRRARREVAPFLSRIHAFNFSKEDVRSENQMYMLDYLGSAKNQMAYDSENFRESRANLSAASARYLLLTRNSAAPPRESVEEVNSSDLRRAAGGYLAGKKCAVVVITPLKPGDK